MKPATDEAVSSLTSDLRADWGLNHLLQALALAEGFGFHILVCDRPKVAQAVLAILEEEASGRVVRLRPRRSARDAREPARFEDISAVLEALVDSSRDPGGEPRITVLDASDASAKDEPVWRELFRRMNERRNVLAHHLAGPLVLCVPPRLEVAFAHEAPDFWSIRSTSVTVSPLPIPTGSFDISRGAQVPSLEENRPWDRGEWERLRAAVEGARRKLTESPDDPTALGALAIQLQRLGRFEEERSTLSRAGEAYEEALQTQRRLSELDSGRSDRLNDLAGLLVDVGDVQRARGSLEEALSSYEESLGLRRRLLSRDPDRPEWLRDLTLSLDRVGSVFAQQEKLDQALPLFEEALKVVHRLEEEFPQQPASYRGFRSYLEEKVTSYTTPTS